MIAHSRALHVKAGSISNRKIMSALLQIAMRRLP
jgi:hypothetical protein